MCQHWEWGPHAQLISTISLIALWAIFVGSTFVIQCEAKAEKEEERHGGKREQEERCYSNSNCPSSLFAFVQGQRAMIRRSPLHFMARPPLQHPSRLQRNTHTHSHTVIGCCNMDKPRSWFLCGIPERTRLPWQPLPISTHRHTCFIPTTHCQSSHNGCHTMGSSCVYVCVHALPLLMPRK